MAVELGIGGAVPITFKRDGAEAVRRWKANYAEAIADAPMPGEPLVLGGVTYDFLRVESCDIRPMGWEDPKGVNPAYVWCEVEVHYAAKFTEPSVDEDEPRISFQFGVDAVQAAAGRRWYRVNPDGSETLLTEYVNEEEVNVVVPYPYVRIKAAYAVGTFNLDTALSYYYHVNDDDYSLPGYSGTTFPAGTLLLEDLTDSARYDYKTQSWYHNLDISLTYRPQKHNYIWYPGKRAWDAEAGEWERDSNGNYIYTEAGQWRPTYPKFYESADFDSIFSELKGTP